MPDEPMPINDDETIAERIVRQYDKPFVPSTPFWVKDEEETKPVGEVIDIEQESPLGAKVEVLEKERKGLKAERYLELIEGGFKPHDAAERMGTTVRDMNKSEDIRKAVKKLIEQGTLPPLVRKAMVRAGLDKIFMESLENPKRHKTALGAAKLIGQDPDVGLNAPPSVIGVNVDMGALSGLFEKVQPIPGLEEILEGGDKEDDF